MTPAALLRSWLTDRLSVDAAAWLFTGAERLREGAADRDLYLLASLVGRRIPRQPLALCDAELAAASASRPGWDPEPWTLDEAARLYLLLASASDAAVLDRRLDRLCSAADVGELVAWYRGLPLYPDQPRYKLRAAEGIRSNMRVVFEAVAHRNPYPAEQLAEPAWNQLVLKALFVGAQLYPIVGLDARRNPALARMLCDFAHERWAASRPVSPELWRCVGPYAEGAKLADLARVLERGTDVEREAAALALRESQEPEAARLLRLHAPEDAGGRDAAEAWQRLAAAST